MEKEKVFLIGFGWASIGFLQYIDTKKYNVNVISTSDKFLYTPLLAQNVVYNRDLTISIDNLKDKCNFVNNTVTDVDFKQNTLKCDSNSYQYNYVVFSHGSEVNTFNIPGVQEHTLFLKTNDDYKKIRDKLGLLHPGSKIAVIGCGLSGAELIGTLNDTQKYNILAIDALNRPLITFNEKLSNYATELWEKNNVDIRLNSMVSKINKNTIEIKGKDTIHFDLAIWCGGIKPNKLTEIVNSKLQLSNPRGIPVNNYLRVNNTNVFAMGDCAVSGLPPTAQVAYQQGKYLAKSFNENLKVAPFKFNDKGQIGYIGNKESVFQNKYISGSGRIIGALNTAIHAYNYGKIYILSKL